MRIAAATGLVLPTLLSQVPSGIAFLVAQTKPVTWQNNPVMANLGINEVASSRSRSILYASGTSVDNIFTEEQLDFIMGYLNKHHRDVLTNFAKAFTPLGIVQAKKNAFSGGSYKITDATIIEIHHTTARPRQSYIVLDTIVDIRGQKETSHEIVKVNLDAVPNAQTRGFIDLPLVPPFDVKGNVNMAENKRGMYNDMTKPPNHIDDFVRRMNRLCLIVKSPSTTGKLLQLSHQIGGTQIKSSILKEDLYLNQVPHNRFVRQYFYDLASQAALDAVIACATSPSSHSNRMKMVSLFPEMNPSMDSYRIGTLLELTRAIAIKLAEQNLRVRVCVQGSMGVGIFTGTPKTLSGASTLLQRMDWQSNEGEVNEGMVGDYVNFGAVGKEHVVNSRVDRRGDEIHQDDVFLIVCPQSMVGVESSIFDPLSEMVDAAGDRPVILLNPDLSDKVSSQGQQNVRGRQARMDFADSFETIYHFQNIYISGTSYFPILGAVTKAGFDQAWIAYQRRDRMNGKGEVYIPILSTEEHPDGQMILETFD